MRCSDWWARTREFAIETQLPFVHPLWPRGLGEFPPRWNEGSYVRVMSSARRMAGERRRRRGRAGKRRRRKSRERRYLVERSTEAQPVSKKRGKVCHASGPGARGWPDHGNPRRVLLSAEQQHRRRRLFEEFAPALRVGGSTSRNRGSRPTTFLRN